MDLVYPPVIGIARTVFWVQGLRFRMEGESHVPVAGGAVMAINHTGYFDFTYAGVATRRSRRLVRFMAKASVFGHPVTGPLMRGMHHIPVDRHAGVNALDRAIAALRAGQIVGLFPEATMSRSFEIKPLKSGAARMARAAGVPILPTTIWGSQRVWTKEAPKHLGRRRIPIYLTVGEPIPVAPDADVDEVTERLRRTMINQLSVQQAHYPPLRGADLRYLPSRLGGTAPTPEEAWARDHHDMTRTQDKFNS
ncbi:MAG TPA: lysophospholipid acyltransferase family protein [Dermatophilaceae bacterium]|nr:lysophospholipid acyltransferase family protein [Dermatophilaceae bacterium]